LASPRRPPLAAPPPRAPLVRPLPHPLELAPPPTSLGGPRRAQALLARPPAPPPLEVQARQPSGAAHSEPQPSRAHLGRRQLRRPPLGHQRQVSCLGNCVGDASEWLYVLNVCGPLAVLIRHCCRVLLFCPHRCLFMQFGQSMSAFAPMYSITYCTIGRCADAMCASVDLAIAHFPAKADSFRTEISTLFYNVKCCLRGAIRVSSLSLQEALSVARAAPLPLVVLLVPPPSLPLAPPPLGPLQHLDSLRLPQEAASSDSLQAHSDSPAVRLEQATLSEHPRLLSGVLLLVSAGTASDCYPQASCPVETRNEECGCTLKPCLDVPECVQTIDVIDQLEGSWRELPFHCLSDHETTIDYYFSFSAWQRCSDYRRMSSFSGSAFGAPTTSAFGAPSSSSLFGPQTSGSIFGGQSTSAFGFGGAQTKPAGKLTTRLSFLKMPSLWLWENEQRTDSCFCSSSPSW
jgi:hypothetical protein